MKIITLLLVLFSLTPALHATSSPWADYPRLAADCEWVWVPGLGWINDSNYPFVNHRQHCQLYQSGTDETNLWFYDDTLDSWWWTSSDIYHLGGDQWTYHALTNTWMNFLGGKAPDRVWADVNGVLYADLHLSHYGTYVRDQRLLGQAVLPLEVWAFKENYLDPRMPGRAIIP